MLQALEALSETDADTGTRAYGALLLSVLCIFLGEPAHTVAGSLHLQEGDDLDLTRAGILDIAQLVWSRSGAEAHSAAGAQVRCLCSLCFKSFRVIMLMGRPLNAQFLPFTPSVVYCRCCRALHGSTWLQGCPRACRYAWLLLCWLSTEVPPPLIQPKAVSGTGSGTSLMALSAPHSLPSLR